MKWKWTEYFIIYEKWVQFELQCLLATPKNYLWLHLLRKVKERKSKHSPYIDYEKISNMKRTVWHSSYLNVCLYKSTQIYLLDVFMCARNYRNEISKIFKHFTSLWNLCKKTDWKNVVLICSKNILHIKMKLQHPRSANHNASIII